MQDKHTLRNEARRHRERLPARLEDAEEACSLFFEALKPASGLVLAAYWPQGREFDTRPIIDEALNTGLICALPVVRPGARILRFVAFDGNTPLEKGPYGIMQPPVNVETGWLEPDIVIVPLLAYDRRGYRLGQGGGYYDATLEDLRARRDVMAVGVAYGEQACLFNLPAEAHDQRLDWVITPQAAIKF